MVLFSRRAVLLDDNLAVAALLAVDVHDVHALSQLSSVQLDATLTGRYDGLRAELVDLSELYI